MCVQCLDTLRQIILRREMVFVDRLEQLVQRTKRHTCHIPMKILREHGGHGGFRYALIEGFGDGCFCIVRQGRS